MVEPERVTPDSVSEQVLEYRRLSDLIRQVYLDESDQEIDLDELGDRFAKRGLVIHALVQMGQKMVIRWLSEEDHLYWRLIVLRRKLRERGATPSEIQANRDVSHIRSRLETADEALDHLVGSVVIVEKNQ